MSTHAIVFLFLFAWTIVGAVTFYQFITSNQEKISDLANKRVRSTWQHYAYGGFMILVGGPLTWTVFLSVFVKRHI